MCKECPLGLNAFLSTRPLKGHSVILSKSGGELHEINDRIEGILLAHGPWYRAYSIDYYDRKLVKN